MADVVPHMHDVLAGRMGGAPTASLLGLLWVILVAVVLCW